MLPTEFKYLLIFYTGVPKLIFPLRIGVTNKMFLQWACRPIKARVLAQFTYMQMALSSSSHLVLEGRVDIVPQLRRLTFQATSRATTILCAMGTRALLPRNKLWLLLLAFVCCTHFALCPKHPYWSYLSCSILNRSIRMNFMESGWFKRIISRS